MAAHQPSVLAERLVISPRAQEVGTGRGGLTLGGVRTVLGRVGRRCEAAQLTLSFEHFHSNSQHVATESGRGL